MKNNTRYRISKDLKDGTQYAELNQARPRLGYQACLDLFIVQYIPN